MENHSDTPATKSTTLPTAVEAAAPGSKAAVAGSQTAAPDAQTAAPGSQTAAPGTDAAPGTNTVPCTDAASSAIGPLAQPSLSKDDAPRDVCVRVEAFGSGKILHGGLDIPSNNSVGDLRELVLSSIKLPPRTRTVRLFVGHGGTELEKDDEALLSGSLAAVDLDTTPLVVFPVTCTSVLWPGVSTTKQVMTRRHLFDACSSFCAVGDRARSRCGGCAGHARVVRQRWDAEWQ